MNIQMIAALTTVAILEVGCGGDTVEVRAPSTGEVLATITPPDCPDPVEVIVPVDVTVDPYIVTEPMLEELFQAWVVEVGDATEILDYNYPLYAETAAAYFIELLEAGNSP